MLDAQKAARAERLYNQFFSAHGQPNPTDINTVEKYEFAFEVGFEDFSLMQVARKESHAFTLLRTWQDRENAIAKAAHEARKGS